MSRAPTRSNQEKTIESGIFFENCSIVACGTLSLELNYLRKSGFLNARSIEYTKPGRHEVPKELERQLAERIGRAKSHVRINATHCVDMLAGAEEREAIRNGEKVFWLTPGWVIHRKYVFQDWDKGKANETFPQNTGGAVLLDSVGFWEDYSARHPEKILDFSDWVGIPIRPYEVSLDRFKRLLTECLLLVSQKRKSVVS